MPNYCENHLSITGDKETVLKFFKLATRKVEDGVVVGEINEDMTIDDIENAEINLLSNLYPTPPELITTVAKPDKSSADQISNKEKYGFNDWYEWRISNWGTKWEDCETQFRGIKTSSDDLITISLSFESAWSPPIEAFDKICTEWQDLLFCLYYEEPGMGFCGKNIWMNGDCIDSEESSLITDYFDEEYLFETNKQ